MQSLSRVVTLSVLSAVLVACGGGGGWTPPPPPVSLQTVATADIPMSFSYAGRVSDSREVEVRARVAGTLVKRAYTEGARVNQGDLLFVIDPAAMRADANAANAQLAQAKAVADQAERDAKRADELFAKGLISTRDRDLASSSRDEARASLQRAQAETERRNIDLGYTRVTAPVSGITSIGAKPEGSYVSPVREESLLTTITQVDPAVIDFAVSESDHRSLHALMSSGRLVGPARGQGSATVYQNGGDKYSHPGKVEYLDVVIDPRTGSLLGRAQFPNPQLELMPGAFVRVEIGGYTLKNAIVLPEKVILQGADGAFVYVYGADGKAHMRTVTPGVPVAGGRVVDAGLAVGDKVIVDNVVKVMPESPVEIADAKAAADAAKNAEAKPAGK